MDVATIREQLADREAIRDCMVRYCRGIDRADPELILSAYWPGAMDYHTGFAGTVEEFVDWSMPRMAQMIDSVHMIANMMIVLDGATAKVETYLWSVSILPGEPPVQVMATGRYLDRFERQDGEWRIAERKVVHDWFEERVATSDWIKGPFGMTGLARGTRDKEDESRTWLGL